MGYACTFINIAEKGAKFNLFHKLMKTRLLVKKLKTLRGKRTICCL